MASYYCTRKHNKIYAIRKKEEVTEKPLLEETSRKETPVENVRGKETPVENVRGKETPVEDIYSKELPVEYIAGKDGPPGKDGRDGKDGPPGKDGRDGVDGKDGPPGKDGRDGKDGVDGKDGPPGKDGVDGKDGPPGKDGRDGKDSSPSHQIVKEDKFLEIKGGKISTNCPFQEIKGESSLSSGSENEVHDYSSALGYKNKSKGIASFTQGINNVCSANIASCMGENNLSSAPTSLTSGINLYNKTKGVTLLGSSGKALPFPYSLQVCGGLNNKTGVGAVLRTERRGYFPESSGIADTWFSAATGYGEWFEKGTLDDLTGRFVTIKEGKVEIATTAEETIGVVTPRLALVGNSAELYWHNASLKDEFSSYISVPGYPDLVQLFTPLGILTEVYSDLDTIVSKALEEAKKNYPLNEVQKKLLGLEEEGLEAYLALLEKKIRSSPQKEVILPNPEYSGASYIPRSRRKEWVKVCLKGRVNVLNNGCKVGERCSVEDGLAVPSKEGYLVLKKSSEKVITILL